MADTTSTRATRLPMAGLSVPTPEDEALRPLRDALRAGGETGLAARVLGALLSCMLFAVVFIRQGNDGLLAVLGTLLIHELGHLAAMRAFGYTNLHLVFIPFFGAAVSGRRTRASPWEDLWVALAGPVPGLFLGFGLALYASRHDVAWLGDAARTMVLLNAVNLLPIPPLDGGKVIEVVLFARSPLLATLLSLLGSVVVLTAALGENAGAGFGGLAYVVVLRLREVKALGRVPSASPGWPAVAEDLGAGELARFAEAARPLTGVKAPTAKRLAPMVERLYQLARAGRVPLVPALGMGLAWAACAAVAFAAVAFLPPMLVWTRQSAPGARWSAEFPGQARPLPAPPAFAEGVKRVESLTYANLFTGEFSVLTTEFRPELARRIRLLSRADQEAFLDRTLEGYATDLDGRVSDRTATEVGDTAVDAKLWTGTWTVNRLHLVIRRDGSLQVVVADGRDPNRAHRFLTSVMWEGPATPAPEPALTPTAGTPGAPSPDPTVTLADADAGAASVPATNLAEGAATPPDASAAPPEPAGPRPTTIRLPDGRVVQVAPEDALEKVPARKEPGSPAPPAQR